MPVVPSLDPSQQVTPNQAPDVQATSAVTAGLLDQTSQQFSKAGDALGQAANAQSQIAIDAQNLANQTRVNDAVNQLRTTQQQLMYDPQSGVMSQTGINAIQRPSGVSLADEYTGKLSDTASTLAGSLSNPEQLRLFNEQASNIATQFHGATTQWEGQQFKSYALSTQDGTIKNATNQVQLAFNDPDQIDAGLNAIRAATYQAGKINGSAATEIEANTRTMTSNALMGAIDTALQKGQITYAAGLQKKYAPDITADDLLKINGKMDSFMGVQAAQNTVQRVLTQMGPQLSNSGFDRMASITQQSESSGNPNAVGPYIPGQGTAKGSMQVMDATNGDPGFGVRPAADNSPAERARVGRDYLQAMLTHYGGDMSKAWAAYNAGPGTLDAAVQKAQAAGTPGTWLANMPPDTQAYVQKNVQAYNNPTSIANRPSKLDVLNAVRGDTTLQAKPEWMAHAVTLAGQQYDEQTAAITQQNEANLAGVYRTLSTNRGDITTVSPADLAKIQPDDMPKVLTYAKSMSEGVNATNTALYQTYITTPSILQHMSSDQWQTQAPNFSDKDFKHLSQVRADMISGTGSNAPASLNTGAMNETVSNRLDQIGIPPTPDIKKDPTNASRVGAIRQFVTESLLDAQNQAGKKFSDAETTDHIDRLFATSLTFRNTLLGFQRPDSTVNMLAMTKSDIPDDVLPNLQSDFKARGIPKPTDGQLLGAYWALKSRQLKLTSN